MMENKITATAFSENSVEKPNEIISISTQNVTVQLQDIELWNKFSKTPTEMVITRQGRRIFPRLRVKISGLIPDMTYCVTMDLQRVDSQKYRFANDMWDVVGPGDPDVKPQYYIHPSSPARGREWMDQIVSFHKVKLTNSGVHKQNGKFVVNSMHRYIPRIYVICSDDVNNLSNRVTSSFCSPETAFFAVTSYQNPKIVECKIEHNPFARAFKDGKKTKRKMMTEQANKKLKLHNNVEMTDPVPNAHVVQGSTSSVLQQSVPWHIPQMSNGNLQADNHISTSMFSQPCSHQTPEWSSVNLHCLNSYPNNQLSIQCQNVSTDHCVPPFLHQALPSSVQASFHNPSFGMQDTNCFYPHDPSSHSFDQDLSTLNPSSRAFTSSQFDGCASMDASCLPGTSNTTATGLYMHPHHSSDNNLQPNASVNSLAMVSQLYDQAADLNNTNVQINPYNIFTPMP